MSEDKTILVELQSRYVLAVFRSASMDEEAALETQAAIISAADRVPGVPVILDLSPLGLIPSLSLGVLVGLLRKFKDDHRRLILVGLQPAVRETLAVCRLVNVFEIYDSTDQALEKVK